MEGCDDLQAIREDDIRQRNAEGMAALRAGQGTDGDAFLDTLDTELAEIDQPNSA
jgi:hypothetical protein